MVEKSNQSVENNWGLSKMIIETILITLLFIGVILMVVVSLDLKKDIDFLIVIFGLVVSLLLGYLQ